MHLYDDIQFMSLLVPNFNGRLENYGCNLLSPQYLLNAWEFPQQFNWANEIVQCECEMYVNVTHISQMASFLNLVPYSCGIKILSLGVLL